MKKTSLFLLPVIAAAMTVSASAAPVVKPLKALLVLGGCCHDYKTQKDILEAGIESRANITVDVCYSADTNTKPALTCYEKDNWADGYDVIIHDECAADTKDLTMVKRILEPHLKGLPGVNLHCAMHSYRTAADIGKPVKSGTNDSLWFDYLGLQSSGHGPQKPIEISYLPAASPITAGFENWTTVNEELYNNISIHDSAKPLAKGKQGDSEKVVVWTNEYGNKKTRVFSTTLGHNNETVSDSRYLDLVTRGLLWSCNKLDKDGKPLAGYGRPPAAVIK
ncbi:MAG: ThuA domain-containing protein [Verrucomicrobiota bacterium]